MSLFEHLRFNLHEAEAELVSFRAWFDSVGFVAERSIVEQVRCRPQMTGLLGPTVSIATPNLIRWELGLGGLFKADLAIGNDARREFCLVEFEGANETSIFGAERTLQSRSWSREIEHGLGQMIDWACYHMYNLRDATMRDNFGGEIRRTTYLLVCGRDAGIVGQGERERFNFRRNHINVQGVPALTLTFDEMATAMADNLDFWKT